MYICSLFLTVSNKKYGVHEIYQPSIQKATQEQITGIKYDTSFLAFRSLPIIALIYIPLSYFDVISAFTIHLIMLLMLTPFLVFAFAKVFKLSLAQISAIILFIFISAVYFYNQSSFFLPFIILGVYACYSKNKYFCAGLIAGLLLIKTQYGIFIPLLIVFSGFKKSFFLGALASIGFMLGTSFLLYGPSFLKDYTLFMIQSESLGFGTVEIINYNLFGLKALLNQVIGLTIPGYAVLITQSILYLIALVALYTKRKNIELQQAFIDIVLLSISLNVHSLQADLIMLLVVISAGFNLHNQRNQPTKYINLLIGFILLLPMCVMLKGVQGISGLIMIIFAFYALFKPLVGDPGLEPGTTRV